MNGVLFKYGPGAAQLAFKSPAARQHPQCPPGGELHLVLVGGLTDGLLFAPYAEKLAAAVGEQGWSLVQAQLSSSYQGWGLSSLDSDAAELALLATHLAQDHSSRGWVLMGHSTGCQDAVRYVQRHYGKQSLLQGVILQAPVSDREYLASFPSWQDKVPLAQSLVQQGRPEEVVLRVMEWDGAAVTARRLVDLCCQGGDDDMFSTDLTLQQLQSVLGPLQPLPCLILQSGADEAVPEALRQSGAMQRLGHNMLAAIRLGPLAQGTAAAAAAGTAASNAASAAADAVGEGTSAGQGVSGVGGSGSSSSRGNWPQRVQVIEGAAHACGGHEAEVVAAVVDFLSHWPSWQPPE